MRIGELVPDVRLPDATGEPFDLRELRGRTVLVWFYPRAASPGCTRQACSLRDAAADLGAVETVGISPDPPARLRRFAHRHRLTFRLLSDPDHAVARAWGAWGERRIFGRHSVGLLRSAFLVDAQGRLEACWVPLRVRATVPEVLAALASRESATRPLHTDAGGT